MAKTIYKFLIPIEDYTELSLPTGSIPRAVAALYDNIAVWVELDPTLPLIPYRFSVYGTGHRIHADNETYVGTVFDGKYVWHVYYA